MAIRPLALISVCLLAFSASGWGQEEVVLEQNFDQIPEGQQGRVGKVLAGGSKKYSNEGRWSEFGTELGCPKIQTEVQRGGNAVELTRTQDQNTHVLHGIFDPIRQASRILFTCDVQISGNSGTIVSLARGNDMAAGVLLRSDVPGIRAWNPESKAWGTMLESPRTNQWLKVVMDCDVRKKTYRAALLDDQGNELVSKEMPFDDSLLLEGGLDNLCFIPQLPEACYIDNVSVKVEE